MGLATNIHKKSKFRTWLASHYSFRESGNGWYALDCPFCDNGKNKAKGAANFAYNHYKCWVCGYSKPALYFVSDVLGVSLESAYKAIESCVAVTVDFTPTQQNSIYTPQEAHISLPEGFKLITEGTGVFAKKARQTLVKRGLDLQHCEALGLGYCTTGKYMGYFIIPFKDMGLLKYYQARSFMNNNRRYINPTKAELGVGKGDVLFNMDALFLYEEVCLVEGWTDAVTVGWEGVSSQGWALSSMQLDYILNSTAKTICLIPDAGTDGKGISFYVKALKLAATLINYKQVKVIDLNPFGFDVDANDLGKEKITQLREAAPLLTDLDIMKNLLKQ